MSTKNDKPCVLHPPLFSKCPNTSGALPWGAVHTGGIKTPKKPPTWMMRTKHLDLREEFHQELVEEQTRDNDSVEQQRGLPPLRHVGRVVEYDKTSDHGTTEICRASRSPTAILGRLANAKTLDQLSNALARNITQELGGVRRCVLRDHRILSTSEGSSALSNMSTLNIHRTKNSRRSHFRKGAI